MNFTWKRFLQHLNPVAIFLAALIGYMGIFPKTILLGIMIWQIIVKGGALWQALVAFFSTLWGWAKMLVGKKEPAAKKTAARKKRK